MFKRGFKLSALLSLLLIGCESIIPAAPEENELLDGPIEGLNSAEQQQFLAGDIAFNDEIFTTETGLGPLFVATSCGGCHPGDGKGHPFTTLTRFGQTEPNQLIDPATGAPQLQNRAIPGHLPETLPSGPSMKLNPPAVTGLGLLAALTDEQILANADPNDVDEDGISGIPNFVSPKDHFVPQWFHIPSTDGKYIGRFGKKAAAIDLLQQTAGAYNQDMGVNSVFEPLDTQSLLAVDPEVSEKTVNEVVFYLRTLKAPLPRSEADPAVISGKQLFSTIGCNSCHIQEWTTPTSDVEALSNKTFYPYTDLLLHDMGAGLDDGVTEGSAETFEWRTPPLWGLGLSPDSQGGEFFLMHDGRAKSIEEAILMHDGEGSSSRNQFESLSSADREALISFLNSL